MVATDNRWPLQDRVAHHAWLKDMQKNPENKSRLFPQQRIVARYLSSDSPYRGLLLYHGLGSGKSCAAIVVAEALRRYSKGIVVFLPASLRSNFVEEVCNCPGLKWSRAASDGEWKQTAESQSSDKSSYFKDLSPAQQQSLRKQVRDRAESMFSFFNYNASNIGDKMAALLRQDPHYFDGKVVIIDEAHNFVSRVVNEGQLKPAYEAMLAARLERIVLLSGTPIVNKPLELSFLINLVRGYSWIYEAKVQSANPGGVRELPGILNQMPEVDEYFFDEVDNVLRVQLVPPGFERVTSGSGAYLVKRSKASSDAEALARLSTALSAKGLAFASAAKRSLVPALPMDEDEFERFFIKEQVDSGTGATRYVVDNGMWLTKRMLGCVSYHESQDPDLFPKLEATEIVGAPMSTLQFTEYMAARQTERRQERVMKSIASKASSSSASSGFDGLWNKSMHTYRSASRMLCNFVFPKAIERPKRSKKEALFAAQVRKAMDAVAKLPRALVEDLSQHSPKFAAMLERFASSKGTCLVYSEFRTIEGIGLLKLALDANGYQQLTLRADPEKGLVLNSGGLIDPAKPKYIIYNDVDDKEMNETLKQMFNSEWQNVPASLKKELEHLKMPTDNLRGQLCKLFMVTKSGAEGITLKNVRQVHLLEPFWHHNRITQVIGRAVRANSHAALPPAERSVRVFLYVSRFTPEQLADRTVRFQDKGLTSDEHVLRVSAMKKEIVDDLLSAVRAAAIDCTGAGCFQAPANAQEGDLIRRFDMALEEEDASFARNLVQVVEIRVRGKTYFWNKDTDEVYDGDSLAIHKKRVVVGRVAKGKLVLGKGPTRT